MDSHKSPTGSLPKSPIARQAENIEVSRHGRRSKLGSEDSSHQIDGPSRSPQPSLFHPSDPPTPWNSQASPGSPFLSPPLSLSGYESPPYKPNLEDVMSLDMYNAYKKRKKSGYQHIDQTDPFSHIEPMASRLQSINETQSEHHSKGSPKSWESSGNSLRQKSLALGSSDDDDRDDTSLIQGTCAISEQKPYKVDPKTITEAFMLKKPKIGGVAGPNMDRTPFLATAGPAWHLDTTACKHSTLGFNDASSSTILRSDQRRRSHPSRPSSHRRRKRQTGKSHDTPATITLRKASTPRSPLHINFAQKTARQTSSMEGIFSSALLLYRRLSSDEGGRGTRVQHDPITNGPRLEHGPVKTAEVLPGRFSARASLPHFPFAPVNSRRRSTLADPALTIAEVSIAPSTFSSPFTSRRHTLLAIEATQRTSIVQVRSKSSIHEIIWNKDDTPSRNSWSSSNEVISSASRSSGNTTSPEDSSNKSIASDSNRGSKEGFTDEFQSSPSAIVVSEIQTVPASTQSPDDLTGWSWNGGTAAQASLGKVIDNDSLQHPTSAPTSTKVSRNISRTISSRSDTPYLESFPPLLDRTLTLDWLSPQFVVLKAPSPSCQSSHQQDGPADDNPSPRKRTGEQPTSNASGTSGVTNRHSRCIRKSRSHSRYTLHSGYLRHVSLSTQLRDRNGNGGIEKARVLEGELMDPLARVTGLGLSLGMEEK